MNGQTPFNGNNGSKPRNIDAPIRNGQMATNGNTSIVYQPLNVLSPIEANPSSVLPTIPQHFFPPSIYPVSTMPTTSNGYTSAGPSLRCDGVDQRNHGQRFFKSSGKHPRQFRQTFDADRRTNGARFTDSDYSNSRQNSGVLSETNLYIKGLSPETSDEGLRKICEEFGEVASTKAIVDKESGRCKGYGFVDFKNPEAAKAALKVLNEREMHCSMAKQQEQDPTNLYIANLPSLFDEEKLQNLLNSEGTVISTRILRSNDGSSRCVGFARMHSKECCDKIIKHFHGKVLEEGVQPLVVKLADSSKRQKRSVSSNASAGIYADFGIGQIDFSSPMQSNFLSLPQASLAQPLIENRIPSYFQVTPQVIYPTDIHRSYPAPMMINTTPFDVSILANQMQQQSLNDSVVTLDHQASGSQVRPTSIENAPQNQQHSFTHNVPNSLNLYSHQQYMQYPPSYPFYQTVRQPENQYLIGMQPQVQQNQYSSSSNGFQPQGHQQQHLVVPTVGTDQTQINAQAQSGVPQISLSHQIQPQQVYFVGASKPPFMASSNGGHNTIAYSTSSAQSMVVPTSLYTNSPIMYSASAPLASQQYTAIAPPMTQYYHQMPEVPHTPYSMDLRQQTPMSYAAKAAKGQGNRSSGRQNGSNTKPVTQNEQVQSNDLPALSDDNVDAVS